MNNDKDNLKPSPLDDSKKYLNMALAEVDKLTSQIEGQLCRKFEQINQDLEMTRNKLLQELVLRKNELVNDLIERSNSSSSSNIDAFGGQSAEIAELDAKIDEIRRCFRFEEKPFPITMSHVGKFNYDPYNFDLMSKLKHLNNPNCLLRVLLNFEDPSNLMNKFINLLSKNMISLVTETFKGKVFTVEMKLFHLDGRLGEYHSFNVIDHSVVTKYKANDKYSLFVSRPSQASIFTIQIYDSQFRKVNSHRYDFKIRDVYLDETCFYIIKSHHILTVSYDFKSVRKFKAIIKRKNLMNEKNFRLLTVVDEVAYFKCINKQNVSCNQTNDSQELSLGSHELKCVSLKTGEVSTLRFESHLIREINQLIVKKDEGRFLVFSKPNNIFLYDLNGNLLNQVSLNQSNYDFDSFQCTRSGHFGFIDSKKNCLFIN